MAAAHEAVRIRVPVTRMLPPNFVFPDARDTPHMPRDRAQQRGAPMDWLHRTKPFLIVAAAVGLATALHVPLDSISGGRFPFMTFFPAILVVTMLCDWRYGALSALLSAFIVLARDVRDSESLFVSSVAIFLAANCVIIWLAETARRACARAEAQAVAARESEQRFNVMADSVPLMIWVHDAAGRMLFVDMLGGRREPNRKQDQ